jgi:DtxR family Mn-dependent transcriptional regulator
MREQERGQRVAEDYVAAIATLEAEGQPVIGARLARAFGVSPPTVTETLHRLEHAGFIQSGPGRELALTPRGRELARRTLRRRRIAERFFVDALGMDVTEAQAEADRVEHALSDAAADRLQRALGDPTICPHGDAIGLPDRAAADFSTNLDRAPEGIDLVVEHIGSEVTTEPTALEEITRCGMVPGSRLQVVAVGDGGLTVRTARGEVAISREAARAVRVRPARPPRVAAPESEPTYRISVTAVQGTCPAGHQSGDAFEFRHCTPSGLCLEALQKLLPVLHTLRLAGSRAERIEVPCPDDGIVTFAVERTPSGTGEPPPAADRLTAHAAGY